MGGPLYVLGVLKTRDAERQGSEERREADYLVASKFLDRARSLGWPEGRTGDGLLKLGHSLIMAGEFDPGAEAIEEVLELKPKHPGELHLLLAESFLAAPRPITRAPSDISTPRLPTPRSNPPTGRMHNFGACAR